MQTIGTTADGTTSNEKGRGSLDVSHDADRDLIRIECRGRWSPTQVDECFAQMRGLATDMRRRLGRIRVLVDRREPVEQRPDTVERLAVRARSGYLPVDRVAVLVGSSLLKSRLRLQLDPSTHQLFMSETAADTWLRAHG